MPPKKYKYEVKSNTMVRQWYRPPRYNEFVDGQDPERPANSEVDSNSRGSVADLRNQFQGAGSTPSNTTGGSTQRNNSKSTFFF